MEHGDPAGNYSEIAPYRPPVTNFITINNQHQRAPKVFSQQLHRPEDPCFSWCHDPAAWTSNSSAGTMQAA